MNDLRKAIVDRDGAGGGRAAGVLTRGSGGGGASSSSSGLERKAASELDVAMTRFKGKPTAKARV